MSTLIERHYSTRTIRKGKNLIDNLFDVRKIKTKLKRSEVMKKSSALFGGDEDFRIWLNTANTTFGKKTPREIMRTQLGLEMVDEALRQFISEMLCNSSNAKESKSLQFFSSL